MARPRSVTTIAARADTVEVAARVVGCRRAGRFKFFLDRGTRGTSSCGLVRRRVAAAPSGTRVQASPCRRRHTSSSRRESRGLRWSDSPSPDASGHDRSRGRAPRTASAPPVGTVQVARRSPPTSRPRHVRERPRERAAHQRARPSGRPLRRHSALLPTPLLGSPLSCVNEGYIDPETLGRALYYRADSGGLVGQLPGQRPSSQARTAPDGRPRPPCQGEGRGFESRRPLQHMRVSLSSPGRAGRGGVEGLSPVVHDLRR